MELVVGVRTGRLELDELWTFVQRKRRWHQKPGADGPVTGDQYTYVALASSLRAIVSYLTGKRSAENTDQLVQDIRQRGSQAHVGKDVRVRVGGTGTGYSPHYRLEGGALTQPVCYDGRNHNQISEADTPIEENWGDSTMSEDDVRTILRQLRPPKSAWQGRLSTTQSPPAAATSRRRKHTTAPPFVAVPVLRLWASRLGVK